MFGEEKMDFHFSKFDHKPAMEELNDDEYEREEEGNIINLASIVIETPDDDIAISLVNNNNILQDVEKAEIDDYLDSTTEVDI